MEGDNIIALKRPDGEAGGTVSLEPGGQFELSGAPLETVHEVCAETHAHLANVLEAGEPLGIGFLGIGFCAATGRSTRRRACPSSATSVMTRYMPKVGTRGLDMMYRTCTIQVNLDFADEADMVQEVPRVAGAAAGRDRASSPARPSRKASPTASSPRAARCGATPTSGAPACCRSCSRTA